jgi:MinD superfamily P-loop ATPase
LPAADGAVHLLDCDVEAPDAHLFLNGRIQSQRVVTIPVPGIDEAPRDGRQCVYGSGIKMSR